MSNDFRYRRVRRRRFFSHYDRRNLPVDIALVVLLLLIVAGGLVGNSFDWF